MIKTETFQIHGVDFIRTYSDSGFKIHGGMPEDDYAVAEDPAELNRTYTETDILIDESDDYATVGHILIGD